MATSQEWMAMLRDGNESALADLTDAPFIARGYDLEVGPDKVQCAEMHVAKTRSAVHRLLHCLSLDKLLVGTIFKGEQLKALAQWKVLDSGKVPSRLAKYQREVRSWSADHSRVQVIIDDRNGVSIEALLIIAPGRARPLVAAIFLSESFQE